MSQKTFLTFITVTSEATRKNSLLLAMPVGMQSLGTIHLSCSSPAESPLGKMSYFLLSNCIDDFGGKVFTQLPLGRKGNCSTEVSKKTAQLRCGLFLLPVLCSRSCSPETMDLVQIPSRVTELSSHTDSKAASLHSPQTKHRLRHPKAGLLIQSLATGPEYSLHSGYLSLFFFLITLGIFWCEGVKLLLMPRCWQYEWSPWHKAWRSRCAHVPTIPGASSPAQGTPGDLPLQGWCKS